MSKHYFKIKNYKLFGGEGSEGYMALDFENEKANFEEVAKKTLETFDLIGESDNTNVECIEITKEEYLEATE